MSRLRRALPLRRAAFAAAASFVLAGSAGLAQAPPEAAFLEAVRSGDTAAVAAWLDRDPDALRRADPEGLQPIHFAAYFGQKAVVELLVARGADLRAGGPLGTPLHAAVFGERTEMVRWLAAQGLDPNAPAEEAPPLLVVAVRRSGPEMVEALLAAGAEPGQTDAAGNAPLHFAAGDGSAPLVRLLLDRGAASSPVNRRGRTPLDVARREGHDAVVELLRARGATGTTAVSPRGPYLGQERPGRAPVVFAPDFVSTERRELNAAFSPDAREMYFARERSGPGTALFVTRLEGTRWSRPAVAPFSTGGDSDVDLFLTADGHQAWFCSNRPDPALPAGDPPAEEGRRTSDIWVVSRDSRGWGAPKPLGRPVNSDADDYYPTLTRDGTLYFSSDRPGGLGANDVYRARRDANGSWTAPVNLGAPVNGPSREYDPLVAPDGSWLVFASERPGGYGDADLYVSPRKADGTWGEPRNLGPAVNTAASEYTPALTPDGRSFLFTRGRRGDDDLYWVDAGVIRRALGGSSGK